MYSRSASSTGRMSRTRRSYMATSASCWLTSRRRPTLLSAHSKWRRASRCAMSSSSTTPLGRTMACRRGPARSLRFGARSVLMMKRIRDASWFTAGELTIYNHSIFFILFSSVKAEIKRSVKTLLSLMLTSKMCGVPNLWKFWDFWKFWSFRKCLHVYCFLRQDLW